VARAFDVANAPVEGILAALRLEEVPMALHRDIYWVGRQWAVTGFGIQAIDQRLKGSFDIDVSQLWDEIAVERIRALAWLNAADFDKAIEIARARYPEPARKKLPLVESVLKMIQPAAGEPQKVAPPPPLVAEAAEEAPVAVTSLPLRVDPLLAIRMERAPAKFLSMWRVR
jgi:hypothetical protein